MSTEFQSKPPIPYDEFVSTVKDITVLPSKLYEAKCCTLKLNGNYVQAVKNRDGSVGFERFGQNLVGEMFRLIEAQFNVEIWSEYGLRWYEHND